MAQNFASAATAASQRGQLCGGDSALIAPIVVQYSGAAGSSLIVVWVVSLVLLGVLAWAVMRSKAPAPSMTEAKAVAVGGEE